VKIRLSSVEIRQSGGILVTLENYVGDYRPFCGDRGALHKIQNRKLGINDNLVTTSPKLLSLSPSREYSVALELKTREGFWE